MVTIMRPSLSLAAAALLWAGAASAAGSGPQVLDLSSGESAAITLADGKSRTIKLIGLREFTEPYFESAEGKITQAVVRATFEVEVDGVKASLTGGPFRMPTAVNGLAVLLSCTRNWSGGISPDPISKEVRLEVRDATLPWVTLAGYVFPIRGYRWRAMNYQHTYLGVVVNQARLYYHRGEDMGMIPDLEQALAITKAEITKVPGPKGDGGSNSVVLEDGDGLRFRYAHMNTPNIRPALQPGSKLERGEAMGLTGNTWRGGPVNDPHLHVEARDSKTDTFRNSFPLIVAAYRASFPGEVLPIAGGWRHVVAGGSVTLDGSLSLAGAGRKITSFEWLLADGKTVRECSVTLRYDRPGTYSEQLRVADDRGTRDSDFVEVFVLSPDQKTSPPYAWINYYPVRAIHVGSEVQFLTRFANMKNVTIEYGDGERTAWSEKTAHRYNKAGTYVVTVRGQDAGSGPGTFHVRVIVE